jgi:hypothetical protein
VPICPFSIQDCQYWKKSPIREGQSKWFEGSRKSRDSAKPELRDEPLLLQRSLLQKCLRNVTQYNVRPFVTLVDTFYKFINIYLISGQQRQIAGCNFSPTQSDQQSDHQSDHLSVHLICILNDSLWLKLEGECFFKMSPKQPGYVARMRVLINAFIS